jgi:MFS transporter, FSR family, fosmidomycin resistance protein
LLIALLFGVELLDELYSGVPAVGAASIQESLRTSHQGVALSLLTGPALLALVLEPVIFVLADRYPRRRFVCGGLLAMAVAAFAAAWAPGPIALAVFLGVAGVAAGCGVTLAQATLIDARPDERERTMTRWAAMGTVGDLLAPALMAIAAWATLGWRHAFAFVGAIVAVWALALARLPFPEPASPRPDEAEAAAAPARWTAALRPRLLLWLLGVTFCDLLDEILVVFASLHLRDTLGAGPAERSLVLAAFVAGGGLGLAITDRLLARVAALRLLAVAAAACIALYLAWLATATLWLSAVLMVGVGAATAPLYPIAAAQAYAALPGRSGTVNAVGHAFTPLAMAFPLGLGWLADAVSPAAALTVLVAQPVVLLVLAVTLTRGPDRT